MFRRWANKVLKDYTLKGYAANQKRLEYLEKTIVFINQFAENVINSIYFPVPKTMPQNMKDELDKYLGNKKCQHLKQII